VGEQRYDRRALGQLAIDCFTSCGVSKVDASVTANALVQADLQARPSHGVSRLAAYISAIQRGKVNPTAILEIKYTGQSVGLLDGAGGLGPLVATQSMETAVDMSLKHGIGTVAAHHSNHVGALSVYTTAAADAGVIAMMFTNAQPAIPPWGGRTAFFGTNPIALAAGQGDSQVSIDLATSIAARGNIIMAAKSGGDIPEGWALDERGEPTTNAQAALAGAVLPMAGAKGYSLALMVEILCGVLSGSAIAPHVGSVYDETSGFADTGLFCIAIHPEFFVGSAAFTTRLQAMVNAIHESPRAEGVDEIFLPGERRRAYREDRLQNGIPLSGDTVAELEGLAARFNLSWNG